jgi:ribosome-associated protein
MDIRKLQRVVIDALEDVKAQNIKIYNTIGLSDMFDRVVLASGTSNRQTRALAYRVAQQVKEAGGHVVSVEGADAGEWVLVDLGDLVVHVMQPAIREYYSLEEIWGGRPIKLKLAESGASRIAARAAVDDQPVPPKPAKRISARKVPRKTPVARKRTAAPAPAAKKRSTKKAASKSAPRKSSVNKPAPRKTGAAAGARKKARAA